MKIIETPPGLELTTKEMEAALRNTGLPTDPARMTPSDMECAERTLTLAQELKVMRYLTNTK